MKTNQFFYVLLVVFVGLFSYSCEKDTLNDISNVLTKEQDGHVIPTNKAFTSFAYGEISFVDAGLSDTQWGWISKYQKWDDTLYFPLFIRDEDYESGEGTNVGEVRLYYSDQKMVADFYTRRGYAFTGTNLYASHKKPHSCDPATFTEHHKFERRTIDRFSVYCNKFPVYIIAHANVVKTQ